MGVVVAKGVHRSILAVMKRSRCEKGLREKDEREKPKFNGCLVDGDEGPIDHRSLREDPRESCCLTNQHPRVRWVWVTWQASKFGGLG